MQFVPEEASGAGSSHGRVVRDSRPRSGDRLLGNCDRRNSPQPRLTKPMHFTSNDTPSKIQVVSSQRRRSSDCGPIIFVSVPPQFVIPQASSPTLRETTVRLGGRRTIERRRLGNTVRRSFDGIKVPREQRPRLSALVFDHAEWEICQGCSFWKGNGRCRIHRAYRVEHAQTD